MPNQDSTPLKTHQSKFIKFLLEGNISIVSLIIVTLSLIVLAGLLYAGEEYFNGSIPDYYFRFSAIIFLLIFSCCGLIQVLREEVPGIFGCPIQGFWAKVSGWILLIITWGLAAYLLI